MIERACARCGQTFACATSRPRHGRGRHCSRDCQYAARREAPRGVAVLCVGCDSVFVVPKSRLLEGRGLYCSRPCRDQNRIREQHPSYRGGVDDDRGPNWQAQKRAARKRDRNTCRHCGRPGRDVHHVIPFRIFGLTRYLEANTLSNLLTLCRPCHRKADALFQAQENA